MVSLRITFIFFVCWNRNIVLLDQISPNKFVENFFGRSISNSRFRVNPSNSKASLQFFHGRKNSNTDLNDQVNMTLTFITDILDQYEGYAVVVTDQIDVLVNRKAQLAIQIITLSHKENIFLANFDILEVFTKYKLLYIVYLSNTNMLKNFITYIRKTGGKSPIICIVDKFSKDDRKKLEKSSYYEIFIATLENDTYKIYEKCAFCESGISTMKAINTWSCIKRFQKILRLNKSFKGKFNGETLVVAHNYLKTEYDKDKDILPAEFRMLSDVSAMLQFHFLMRTPKDGEWGRYKNGEWTGLVGMVQQRQCDIAIGSLSINEERFDVVNPTAVLEIEGHAIVSARPQKSPRWQAIFEAFNLKTWFFIVLALIVTGVLLRISLCMNEQSGRISIIECLFIPFKIICVEPVSIKTPSFSTILILTFWLQMSFILLTFYTGSLTSLVTSPPHTEKPIDSAEDLLKSGKIWLSMAGNANYEALDHYIESGLNKINYPNQSVDSRIQMVLENNQYTFLVSKTSPMLKSFQLVFENDQNPIYVGKNVVMFLVNTWVVSKFCPFIEDLSVSILKIQETGLFGEYENIYNFHQRYEGEKFRKYVIKSEKISISFAHFQKIGIVFLLAYLVAFVIFISEFFLYCICKIFQVWVDLGLILNVENN